MMEGSHLEDSFSLSVYFLCYLEASYLNDIGYCLKDINDSDDNCYKGISEHKSESYYRSSKDPDYRKIVHDINNVYGLNGLVDPKNGRSRRDTTSGIVKQRKDAYISMFDELMRLEGEGALTPELVLQFRESLLSDEKWEPFIGVKLYVLDMFLKTLEE